jgi:hypothetical protein
MDIKTLKREYEKIGGSYSTSVLAGYVEFFSFVLGSIQDKRNTEYRINKLRLMVYRMLLKEHEHDTTE